MSASNWSTSVGTKDNDLIVGDDDRDIIISRKGDDTIYSGAGNDLILSGSGNDIIHAGDDRDRVLAGSGNDIVYGESGDDRLYGQLGNDYLVGGSGNDIVSGGFGDDTLVYDIDINQNAYDYYSGGLGEDTLLLKVTDVYLESLNLTQQDIMSYFANENYNKFVNFSGLGFNLTATGIENIQIEIEITNQPPVIEDAIFNINENLEAGTIVGVVVATDPDIGDTLSYSIIGGNVNNLFSIDSNGQIITTATLDYEMAEQYTLTVEVGDEGDLVDTATITINVNDLNDAPIVESPLYFSTTEDESILIDLFSGASDQDGDELSIDNLTLISGNSAYSYFEGIGLGIFFGIIVPGKPDATFYDYLKEGEQEIITYNYDIVDNNGGVVNQTVTIEINGINDAPYRLPIASSFLTFEDSGLFTISNLLQGVKDSESDPLTIFNFQVSAPIPESVTFDGNDTITIDPSFYNYLAAGESVGVGYSYDVSDGNGGVLTGVGSGGAILGVNDAPTDIQIDNLSVNENELGVVIGNITVDDVDISDTHEIVVDDLRFEVVDDQLKLKDGETLDYETEQTITLNLTATDSGGDLAVNKEFTINVLNDESDDLISPDELADTIDSANHLAEEQKESGKGIGEAGLLDNGLSLETTLSLEIQDIDDGQLNIDNTQSLDLQNHVNTYHDNNDMTVVNNNIDNVDLAVVNQDVVY